MRQSHETRPRHDRPIQGRENRRGIAAHPDVGDGQLHSPAIAQDSQRPEQARMLQGRGHDPIALTPVHGSCGNVHAVRGGMGQGDAVRAGPEDGGHRRASLGLALERVLQVVAVGPAGAELPCLGLGHGMRGLARERPARAGVEVDAGGSRRQGFPESRDLLVIGEEWTDHCSL